MSLDGLTSVEHHSFLKMYKGDVSWIYSAMFDVRCDDVPKFHFGKLPCSFNETCVKKKRITPTKILMSGFLGKLLIEFNMDGIF